MLKENKKTNNLNNMMKISLLLLPCCFGFSASTTSAAVTATASISVGGGSSAIHVPVGKDGEGQYTAETKGCFDVIEAATPVILNEVLEQNMRNKGSKAYHIADYGTADAGTSLGLLTKMVKTLRQRDAMNDKEVVIHYEDQITNEWQSVFVHAFGNKMVEDAYGNPVDTPYSLGNVFVEASGVSFHNQAYPSESIDFGVSFTAMHWLSAFPNSFNGKPFMHAAQAPPSLLTTEKEQAANDWKSILEARSKELVKGGKFACVNFCVSKDGHFLGQTDEGASMWDSFQTAWDKLKVQGLIDEEERLAVSFPSYYRTSNEILEGVSEVPGLKVLSIEEKTIRCPYKQMWLSGESGLSAREYAETFVPTTRSWSNATFRSALKPSRTDKEEVLSQFWNNYIDLVAKDPSQHGMDYVHTYTVFEKV